MPLNPKETAASWRARLNRIRQDAQDHEAAVIKNSGFVRKETTMQRVVIESPFKTIRYRLKDGTILGCNELGNLQYARAAAHDCLVKHNEAPWGSHLLYTQPGILDDAIPEERMFGIQAGLVWSALADKCVIYIGRGLSEGVRKYGIPGAEKAGIPIEYRRTGCYLEIPEFADMNVEELLELEILPEGA